MKASITYQGKKWLSTAFWLTGASATGCKIVIYSGTAPALVDSAPSGVSLAICAQMGTFIYPTEAGGIITETMTPASGLCFQCASAAAGGTAGYWRFLDQFNTQHFQGSVGLSGAELNLNTLTILATQQVNITSFIANLTGPF